MDATCSSDLDVLKQKWTNYKKFLKEVSTNQIAIKLIDAITCDDITGYAHYLLTIVDRGGLDQAVQQTCQELGIADQHQDKITKYYQCFIDYIKLIDVPQEIVQKNQKIDLILSKVQSKK